MFNAPQFAPVVMVQNPAVMIPSALSGLSYPDEYSRVSAIQYLLNAHATGYAQMIVSCNGIPILIHALRDTNKNVRCGALMLLSDFSNFGMNIPFMLSAGILSELSNFNLAGDKNAEVLVRMLVVTFRKFVSPPDLDSKETTTPVIRPHRENKGKPDRQAAAAAPQEGNQISDRELRMVRKLGQGGFGIVWEASWQGHTTVAVKKLINQDLGEDVLIDFRREADMHAQLRHPNIVILYGVCVEPMKYAMVMEYMPKGSLYDALQNESFSWSIKLRLACDIASGLQYLHHNRIIHRDLKSLNVLVNENNKAKLSDFGLSKVKNNTESMTTGPMGSICWMAPELFESGGSCSTRSDIYALGMILWEIITEKLPYRNFANHMQIIRHVTEGGRESLAKVDNPKYAALITDCWKQRSVARPTAEEVTSVLHTL